MSDEPDDDYQAYMLRLWRAQCQGRWEWRASLESPHTDDRQLFASLEQLFGYLRERCSSETSDQPCVDPGHLCQSDLAHQRRPVRAARNRPRLRSSRGQGGDAREEAQVGRGTFDRLESEPAAREKSPGLSMSDLLTMPEPQNGLLKWMIRQGAVAFADVVAFLGWDEGDGRLVLVDLLDRGWIREIEMRGVAQYRVRLAPKRGRVLPEKLWQTLSDKVEGEEGEGP